MPNLPPRPLRPPARTAAPRVERPEVPEDVKVRLPSDVRRDVKSSSPNPDVADEVLRALTHAGALVADGAADEALPFLLWAKQAVGRSGYVRELLGIVRYQREEWREAVSELRAYQRLLAKHDQSHLVADALRGLGRSPAEVGEAVREMLDDDEVDAERRVEGIIIWASALADAGERSAARAVLRRADRTLLDQAGEEATLRLTYVVGDLAEQAGRLEDALAAFRRVASAEGDPYEAADRVAALEARLA